MKLVHSCFREKSEYISLRPPVPGLSLVDSGTAAGPGKDHLHVWNVGYQNLRCQTHCSQNLRCQTHCGSWASIRNHPNSVWFALSDCIIHHLPEGLFLLLSPPPPLRGRGGRASSSFHDSHCRCATMHFVISEPMAPSSFQSGLR
eukprot:jgi/Botrbrau1/12031/Bobra.0293s0008.1